MPQMDLDGPLGAEQQNLTIGRCGVANAHPKDVPSPLDSHAVVNLENKKSPNLGIFFILCFAAILFDAHNRLVPADMQRYDLHNMLFSVPIHHNHHIRIFHNPENTDMYLVL